MLKQGTINLLNKYGVNYHNIFSICIGKSFLFQKRFINYLGNYSRWDTSIKEGILKLDDKLFNVEYIGTTSVTDNYWFSSELESAIPDQYVTLMMNTRKIMQSLNLQELTEGKILLNGNVNGFNLSMIYMAFAPENVAYYCGSGDTSIYMFVKQLPDNLFQKITSVEFPTIVMEIISTFNVNHKLLIEAMLCENDIAYQVGESSILAKFSEDSILNIDFNNNGLIVNISGNISK
jgi:hypothetical protein